MSLAVTEKQNSKAGRHALRTTRNRVRSCLLSWEIYPILLVAAFLRLYRLDTTEFAYDQSVLYRLAYDAVHYGLIPVTSNSGSIFAMHPPLAIYFLMLPVLFSADPLWAAVMTALFNVVAVLLTYFFTRRYYGRLAAIVAASLFATAETSIVFSRFIWQPTLLAPFVVLFLFALFWGVVERRQGWLFPALLLLGVMYQLHEITLVLAVPLFVALLLAPWRALRLRDVMLALVFLLIIFAPYLIWEAYTKFADIQTLLRLTKEHAHIDDKALTYYIRFLNSYYYDDRFLRSTYYDPAGSASSLVFKLLPLLTWTRQILLLLLLGGFAAAVIVVLRSGGKSSKGDKETITEEAVTGKQTYRATSTIQGDYQSTATTMVSPTIHRMFPSISSFCSRLWDWWLVLRTNPQKCGLIVLLAWQIVPVLILSSHSATVHLHYLLMILPGPFILIGFVVVSIIAWLRERASGSVWRVLRCGTYIVTVLILIVQLVGSTASLIDKVNGINNHIFGYNDLGSLQHAISQADQVALQHHLSRVFISVSEANNSQVAMPFLAQQMHTPVTLFDPSGCLVLPDAKDGPAVYLFRSTDKITPVLLSRFTTATLIDQPPLLGTTPFQLYIVKPIPQSTPAPIGKAFVNQLQLLEAQAQLLSSAATTGSPSFRGNSPSRRPSFHPPSRRGEVHPRPLSQGGPLWSPALPQQNGNPTSILATRWTLLHNEPAKAFTTYTYSMRAHTQLPGAAYMRTDCMLTSIHAGDQLVTTFALPQVSGTLASISITSQFLTMSPETFSQGSLHFETFNMQSTSTTLQTEDGSGVMSLAGIAPYPLS
jgi:4-amino-4-deoxy-L-arabinose transferase-like glycosyltransferase